MELHGKNLIGGELSGEGEQSIVAKNPATGETLSPKFYEATTAEVDRAFLVCRCRRSGIWTERAGDHRRVSGGDRGADHSAGRYAAGEGLSGIWPAD